jgi:hypothetical protein
MFNNWHTGIILNSFTSNLLPKPGPIKNAQCHNLSEQERWSGSSPLCFWDENVNNGKKRCTVTNVTFYYRMTLMLHFIIAGTNVLLVDTVDICVDFIEVGSGTYNVQEKR